jgi:hypothetical protein
MTELKTELLEAFAQALSRGLPTGRAATAAGYAPKGAARERSERSDVITRVAEIERQRAEALCDPAPVIARLIAKADAVGPEASPAALREARGMLADAAALQAALRASLSEAGRDMSLKEWARRYGPED